MQSKPWRVLDMRGYRHRSSFASVINRYISANINDLINEVERDGNALIALQGFFSAATNLDEPMVDLIKDHMNSNMYPIRLHEGRLNLVDNMFYLTIGPVGIADLAEATYGDGYIPRRALSRGIIRRL